MKASRSTWTRAAFSSLVVIGALASVELGCAPQLIIVLEKDPALTQAPGFVKFQMGERGKAPEVHEFGPFDSAAIPDDQFVRVVPDTEFFIDVIGCNEGDPELCDEAAEFNARGCTPYMTLGRDEVAREVVIIVKGAVEGDAECPPPP
jgi:hypothetical protein